MKVYELTTNGRDGFRKYYVRGLKNDKEAIALSKKALGKFAWAEGGGVSYYDDEPSNYHDKGWWIQRSMTKAEFLKYGKEVYKTK